MFDKLRAVNEAAIVNNKRLGAALKFARINQAKRELEIERNLSDKQKQIRQIRQIRQRLNH